MDEKCAICDKKVNNEDEKVICAGSCPNIYHFKCLGFNATAFKFYKSCQNLRYTCEECDTNPEMALHNTIKSLLSYICIIDERLNRQGQLMHQMIEEIGNISSHNNEKDAQLLTKISETIAQSSEPYAGVVKAPEKNESNNAVVIVQPKKNQSSKTTKIDLTKSIDPTSFDIGEVRNIRNGGVVINCKSNEDINKLREIAINRLGDNYTVQVPQLRKHK